MEEYRQKGMGANVELEGTQGEAGNGDAHVEGEETCAEGELEGTDGDEEDDVAVVEGEEV